MFSTMTYTFVIASLFGTVCLTKPAVDDTALTSVEQVYKVGEYPATEYYHPVYLESSANQSTVKTETISLYESLLNEP